MVKDSSLEGSGRLCHRSHCSVAFRELGWTLERGAKDTERLQFRGFEEPKTGSKRRHCGLIFILNKKVLGLKVDTQ